MLICCLGWEVLPVPSFLCDLHNKPCPVYFPFCSLIAHNQFTVPYPHLWYLLHMQGYMDAPWHPCCQNDDFDTKKTQFLENGWKLSTHICAVRVKLSCAHPRIHRLLVLCTCYNEWRGTMQLMEISDTRSLITRNMRLKLYRFDTW